MQSLLAALIIALLSLIGVFFFGNRRRLTGLQKYAIPVAVGVFLSLTLFELIPETLELSPTYGALVIALGFMGFYILATILHKKYHHPGQQECSDEEACEHRGAAILIVIGDALHNIADGVVLGSAFLVNPAVGIATAVGLGLHEIPQEIVEFGVLIRAGYTRTRAALLNLLSASSIIIGVLIISAVAERAEQYIWIFTGLAAGNLLFLAASDLLPRIHGNLEHYGGIWKSALSISIGFAVMTTILLWSDTLVGIL